MMILVLLIKLIYIKDPNEAKYWYLIKKCRRNGLESLENLMDLIGYLNNMKQVYRNIKEYNPDRKCNLLTVFDDMIADMIINKM